MSVKDIQQEIKQDKQDEQLFSNIVLNEKTFTYDQQTHGFDLMIRIKKPTLSQREFAEALFAKSYNKLLQDPDNLTTEQLIDLSKKRGVWTDTDEEVLIDIDNKLQSKKDAIKGESNEKKIEKLKLELANLRSEKFRLAVKLGKLTQTSIDNQAEKAKYEYLLVNCVFLLDENGKETRLYNSIEDLNNEQNLKRLERILLDARSFWTGEGLLDFLQFDD